MSCAAGSGMMKGGRRRRGGDPEPPKQDVKKGGRRRTMKGGNFYGVGAAIAPGAIEYNAVENNAVDPKTGAAMPDYSMPGGRRRRGTKKSKKTTKKSRKSRRRTMRGGANWVSSAGVGAAFRGDGSAGLANYSAYAPKAPVGGPTQNPDGAYRA